MNDEPVIFRLASAADIEFTEGCVIIADRKLPRTVLDRFPSPILVEAGEGLKSLTSIESLAARVLSRRAMRPLTLVAVGGGSVGDAVGFLAHILWRGTSLWHVPTTLLAMADSAHGGKSAVNLASAKNQLGAFHSAERVIIVEQFLTTLPLAQRREGLTEMLKAFMLADRSTILSLTPDRLEELAYRPYESVASGLMDLLDAAVSIKLEIVKQDPLERKGIRTALNLGHTLGHALEAAAGIPHGLAVAWGLAAMLELSADTGLPAETLASLFALLYPLLQPISFPDRDILRDNIGRDKKRSEGSLKSVLLRDIGLPAITSQISADDWISAFERVFRRFLETPVVARLRDPKRAQINVEAGKSELNRALCIAAQRIGQTRIMGRSRADDVLYFITGLRTMGFQVEDTADGYMVDPVKTDLCVTQPARIRRVQCGDGGTTFRFLLALACANIKETRLYLSPQLDRRPHQALIRALGQGGARIERISDSSGDGYSVRGWEQMPLSFSVDASESSQFASAIALLSAGSETPFTLRLTAGPASPSFLDMTLEMLKAAGVENIRNGDLIAFNPTARLGEPLTMDAPPDASAAAVWRTAQFFEHPLVLTESASGHPDTAIEEFLDVIVSGQRSGEIVLDCSGSPDLVPLLVIASLRSSKPVRVVGVSNLRLKESNRLEGIAASLARMNIRIETTPDGIRIPPAAAGSMTHGIFETYGDHRLVMAGLLISMLQGEVELTHPWSVAKSYPEFWNHAREAGWQLTPSLR